VHFFIFSEFFLLLKKIYFLILPMKKQTLSTIFDSRFKSRQKSFFVSVLNETMKTKKILPKN